MSGVESILFIHRDLVVVFAVAGWETSRRQDFVHVPIGHIKTGKDSTLSPKQSIIPRATQTRSFHPFSFGFDSARKWQRKRHKPIADPSDPPSARIIVMAIFRFASPFLSPQIFLTDSCLQRIASRGEVRESDWLSASIGVDTLLYSKRRWGRGKSSALRQQGNKRDISNVRETEKQQRQAL